MTFLATPENYTQAAFAKFVATLKWTTWRPSLITLHNTAIPTLAQWMGVGASPLQRVHNLNTMYANVDRWHSGPHCFIDAHPDGIWNACDLTHDGVSVSCWNHTTIGIEMVGNYATDLEQQQTTNPPPIDDWLSPLAQQVKANAVFAMAVLYRALGLRPDNFVLGVSGLQFHKFCTQDHHACPGGQVDHDDMIKCVLAKMEELRVGTSAIS